MMSPQMTRLDEHLQRLRLSAVRERLEALLQEAAAQELFYADFLDWLLSEEVEVKTAKHVTMRTSPWPVSRSSRDSTASSSATSPRSTASRSRRHRRGHSVGPLATAGSSPRDNGRRRPPGSWRGSWS